MFMRFDKYLFLEVINILILIGIFKQYEIKLFKKYLKPIYLSHIGFEAKQEMKSYYNIVAW